MKSPMENPHETGYLFSILSIFLENIPHQIPPKNITINLGNPDARLNITALERCRFRGSSLGPTNPQGVQLSHLKI
jgi:hypothetical protein